jgi:hypothetical protein
MRPTAHIKFLLQATIDGMCLNSIPPEGLEFIPPGTCDLRFVLTPEATKDASSCYGGGLLCKVYKSYPATVSQVMFVESLNNDNKMVRVAEGISLPFSESDRLLISEDGSCTKGFFPRRHQCPSDISELIYKVELELIAHTNRFLKLLRWRQGADAPAELIAQTALYWEVGEGQRHHLAPLGGGSSFTLNTRSDILWGDDFSSELGLLWEEKGITEPLGHELVREAIALASDSPRSSILIMTAALEAAVKIHISNIAPDTAWLMDKLPSPPILKILRDYIPLIHKAKGNEIMYWDKVKPYIKKVQPLIELRNKVAHSGKFSEGAALLEDNLQLVSDLIYLLDVLDGREWAKNHVSIEFIQALGWPNSVYPRPKTTLTLV